MFVPLMFGDMFLKSRHLPCVRRVYPHVVLQVVYPLLSVLVSGCGHCQVVQPVLVSATAAAVIIVPNTLYPYLPNCASLFRFWYTLLGP